jgi:hypothetical protein
MIGNISLGLVGIYVKFDPKEYRIHTTRVTSETTSVARITPRVIANPTMINLVN